MLVYENKQDIFKKLVFFGFREQTNNPALIAFLAIFITISLCLLILLVFGKKIKRIICHRDADTKQGGMLRK